MTHHERRLPRYLACAYVLLTIYACLYPFSGWRDPGADLLSFLRAPWPRYSAWTDLWLNMLGYLPLGFTLAASLRRMAPAVWVITITTVFCLLFSGTLETLQSFLPARVASNVDLATNTLGGLFGALAGLYWGSIFDDGGLLYRWRRHRILPGHIGEMGLLIVALWWLSQLEPTSTLFATGDMRPLFELPAAIAYSAKRFVLIETMIVAMNVLAVGLLLQRCMREPSGFLVLVVLLVGLAVRSLADYVFIVPADPWQWATPGALRGLLAGTVALIVAWRLPGWLQHSLACMALLICTALVNIAPENPFELTSMRLVHESHFLNFQGLTRLSDFVWPFLAILYLTANAALTHRR